MGMQRFAFRLVISSCSIKILLKIVISDEISGRFPDDLTPSRAIYTSDASELFLIFIHVKVVGPNDLADYMCPFKCVMSKNR